MKSLTLTPQILFETESGPKEFEEVILDFEDTVLRSKPYTRLRLDKVVDFIYCGGGLVIMDPNMVHKFLNKKQAIISLEDLISLFRLWLIWFTLSFPVGKSLTLRPVNILP